MAKHTLSGFLGILVIPDTDTVRTAVQLTEKRRIAAAEYLVKAEGVHITLYQAQNFAGLPLEVAHALVGQLNRYLVTNRAGQHTLHLLDVELCANDKRFVFWNVHKPYKDRKLQTAHAMSLALSAWVKPELENEHVATRRINDLPEKKRADAWRFYSHQQLFDFPYVEEDYGPHITLAANTDGFDKFKPFHEPTICTVSRIVLARMGKWGKIDEILF